MSWATSTGAGNPALDHQPRVGAGDRDLRAVLAEEYVLVPDERLPGRVDTAERAFGHRIRTAVRVTVVNGVVQLSARQLLSRPAENPLGRRVHQGDAIFAVGDEDGIRRAVGYRGEQAELFGELLLGPLAGGDVGTEGLKRKDVAGVVEKSVEVTQVPAHLPVRPRASCFLVPLRMLGRERHQLVEKPWPLVSGGEVEPAPADQLFRLSAVKFGIRPVDEGEGRIR